MKNPERHVPVWHPFVEGLSAFVQRRVPGVEAEDVLQDTLLRLHRATGTLRDEGRVEAWVYGIARRTIADHYRRRDVAGQLALDERSVADPEAGVSEQLARFDGEHGVHEEVLSWLRPMAESLPDPYRQALVLADFEGHTQQDVAHQLGLTLSGAKSRVQRARALLGEAVQSCCEVEFGPDARATAFRRLQRR